MSVKFEVVGQACNALQSPQNLPPLYAGEKLVVYGVLSNVTLPLKGTATLKGQMGENKIDQVLSFEIELGAKKPSLPTIHHLAAKALIKDWQTSRKNKEDIVKLSIEGSVISSHTAFIAVDEESSESISGAMKTHDIQVASADRGLQQQVASVQACMALNIDQVTARSERLEDLECRSEALNSQAMSFQKKAKSKGGFSFGGFFSGLFGSKNQDNAPPAPKAAAPVSRYARDDSMKELEYDDDSGSDLEEESACLEDNITVYAPPQASASKMAPPPPKPATASFAPSDALTALINAQQANGSWVFNPSLAQHLGKPLKELEDACPKDVMSVAWATVLVLTLLKKKFSGQQDEWELIAMKAESWLKKQSLPSGMSIEDLLKAAKQLIL